MGRKNRSKAELKLASDHLYYEIWMFFKTANALSLDLFGSGPLSNALLESFTIHLRVILYFLYDKNPRNDDVIASDFIPAQQWESFRPTKSDLLDAVHKRVGKEIAHLSYARQNVRPENKQWHFQKLATEIKDVLKCFNKLVSPELLGERWMNNNPIDFDG